MIKIRIPIFILALVSSCNTAPTKIPFQVIAVESEVSRDELSTGGVSLADLDDDGFPDLLVTNGYDVSDPMNAKPQRNRMYKNKSGVFSEDTLSALSYEGAFSSGSSIADTDNDGDLDVFIVNQRDQSNQFFINENGAFVEQQESALVSDGGESYSSAWIDVDNDGLLDLHVGNGGLSHRGRDFMYRNLGNNAFEKIQCEITKDSTATIGGVWADFNGDNKIDFLHTDPMGPETFFFNEGNWMFRREILEKPREANSFPNSSAAAADFDNDGDLDVFLCSMYGNFNSLYVNDGSGKFSLYKTIHAFPEGGHSYLAHWMDLDNDGWQELLVLNWGSSPVLYQNNQGTFARVNVPGLTDKVMFPATVASADFQGNGLVDFVVGQWPNFPGEYCRNPVYENKSDLQNNWIEVKLIGNASNRSAIGAKVFVTLDQGDSILTQLREVTTHSSWRSQSDVVQHMGLGKASVIQELKVVWPSGAVTVQHEVKVNAIITIEEEPE